MKAFFTHPLTIAIGVKIAVLVIGYLMVQLHLTVADLEQAQMQIEQLQQALIGHHVDHHDGQVLGLEPGCADQWHQFWAWLTNNACAGGSRN